MTLADFLRETLDEDDKGGWRNERTRGQSGGLACISTRRDIILYITIGQ
jgi:hypothetical protein